MAKYDAFGAQLQVSDGAAVPAFTAIAQLTSIDGPGLSTEVRDATTHDSAGNAREKRPGFLDGGTVDIEGYYDPAHATHNAATGIVGIASSRATRDFKVIDPSSPSATTTFRGFFSAFRRTAPHDGMLGFTATIEVTGLPTFP